PRTPLMPRGAFSSPKPLTNFLHPTVSRRTPLSWSTIAPPGSLLPSPSLPSQRLPLSNRLSAAASLSPTISLIAASLVFPSVSLAVAAASSLSLALAPASFLSLALAAFPFPSGLPSLRCRRFFSTASQIPTVSVPLPSIISITLFHLSSLAVVRCSIRRLLLGFLVRCFRSLSLICSSPATCSCSKTKVGYLANRADEIGFNLTRIPKVGWCRMRAALISPLSLALAGVATALPLSPVLAAFPFLSDLPSRHSQRLFAATSQIPTSSLRLSNSPRFPLPLPSSFSATLCCSIRRAATFTLEVLNLVLAATHDLHDSELHIFQTVKQIY
ncbi:hypothetical protein ACLOJK_036777, partial [Asimina triloba]